MLSLESRVGRIMEQVPSDIVQRSGAALREGYSPSMRRFELGSIAVYACVMVWLVARIAPQVRAKPWLVLTALLLGYVAADLISGIVHWAADTWGTPDWPVIGKALIRPFREHHLDQKAITRHDFVEINGNNCAISVPVGVAAALLPQDPALGLNLFVSTFAGSLIVWVLFTNQFHKWAHEDSPPRAVAFLQKLNLVLPPEHHAVHHRVPYATYYCITVGWLNAPLQRLHFFAGLEHIITAVTGLLPREDDLGKRAALVLFGNASEPCARAAGAAREVAAAQDAPVLKQGLQQRF
jgi:ubiquitin-conjugating enzyme E2 variant